MEQENDTINAFHLSVASCVLALPWLYRDVIGGRWALSVLSFSLFHRGFTIRDYMGSVGLDHGVKASRLEIQRSCKALVNAGYLTVRARAVGNASMFYATRRGRRAFGDVMLGVQDVLRRMEGNRYYSPDALGL